MQNKHNNFQPQQQPYFLFLHILKFRKGQNETWITKIESFRSKNEDEDKYRFYHKFPACIASWTTTCADYDQAKKLVIIFILVFRAKALL